MKYLNQSLSFELFSFLRLNIKRSNIIISGYLFICPIHYLPIKEIPMNGILNIFCNAIQNQNIISFVYNNQLREVEPYILFKSKDGKYLLNCFNIEDYRKNEKPPYWINFEIPEIKDFKICKNTFSEIRKGYNWKRKEFHEVICHV
jgi:hypothetical protein